MTVFKDWRKDQRKIANFQKLEKRAREKTAGKDR